MQTLDWIRLDDQLPDPDEWPRVLIYTEGHEFFNDKQFFDVQAVSLNKSSYANPEDQPEVSRYASHWAPLPIPNP